MSKTRSLRQAAARLNIPATTFSGYVRAGRGPRHIRLDGIYLFDDADCDAWLRARTIGGAQ